MLRDNIFSHISLYGIIIRQNSQTIASFRMSIFGRVQNLICEKLLNNSCSTISCKCTHFMNSVYRLIFDYHEDIMWDMFLIINQYFQALTNTCLVFTCKLCYGKLARLMLTIIVMYLLWAFISMLL